MWGQPKWSHEICISSKSVSIPLGWVGVRNNNTAFRGLYLYHEAVVPH